MKQLKELLASRNIPTTGCVEKSELQELVLSSTPGFPRPAIPSQHLEMLRGDPSLAAQFDAVYGMGEAAGALAQGVPEIHSFGARDRSEDLGHDDPVHMFIFTVESFSPHHVAPLKKCLVQRLSELYREAS